MAENPFKKKADHTSDTPKRAARMRILPAAVVLLALVIFCKSLWLISYAVAQVPSMPDQKQNLPDRKPVNSWSYKPPPVAVCKPPSFVDVRNAKILLALHARQSELKHRAEMLDRKQALVAAAEHALKRQVAALKQVEAKLTEVKAKHDVEENTRWHALVATYEAMDPHDAARIFDKLDSEVVLKLLQRMSSRKSAAILAAMTPDKARSATERMAGLPSSDSSNLLNPGSQENFSQ